MKKNKDSLSYIYWNFRARQRQLGIDVDISRQEWIDWWVATGKLSERGTNNEQWCMARIDKTEGFTFSNIQCIQNKYNR